MMKNFYISAFIVLSALIFQVHIHASCYSEYHGSYQDANVKLIIKTTHSSGPTNRGFYSSRDMVLQFVPQNNDVTDVRIVVNNILYHLKKAGENTIRISLYRSMPHYKITLLYDLPNKDKNAPRWKRKLRVINDLIITQEKKGGCHYSGVLNIKQVK